MITLHRMSLRDCWRVIPWRNACRTGLRTPTDDTRWSQLKFYLRVILNPWSPHRYRSVYRDGQMVGMVGLCNRTPLQVEISLITDPALRGQGIGRAAVELALDDAATMGVRAVWGEVYCSNVAKDFWPKLAPDWWETIYTKRDGQIVPAYFFGWWMAEWRKRRAA